MKSGQGWFAMSRSVSISLPPAKSIIRPSERLKTESKNTKSVLPTVQELVKRESAKKISQWFRSWRHWQQRIFVCRVLEHCGRRQLQILATVLEPVLHIGFSSSLAPHLASLHVDGAATFQVQRGILQRLFSDELLEPSVAYLPSLPTTLLTSERSSSTTSAKFKAQEGIDRSTVEKWKTECLALPPVLPLTHIQHALPRESSLEDVLELRHTRFSSVPDFRSTTDLLRCVKRKDLFRPQHHKRSHSLGSYLHTKSQQHQRQREAEQFQTQLASVSEVYTCMIKQFI